MIEQSQLTPESRSPALAGLEERASRVLFISYQFPPVGGAGVQRPAKFVKYLREFGWEATVLTPSNPSVPVFDESLCADLPDDLAIVTSRTWEPGYEVKQNVAGNHTASGGIFNKVRGLALAPVRALAGALLQPDPQVLWLPSAFQAASRVLQQTPHDLIFATAPPFSDLVLGSLLKRRFGLPLVVDYRDEWDLSSRYLEHSRRDWWARFVQERMQRWVLRTADAVVATTRSSADRLLERSREARSSATTQCIYNGFDDDDFPFESRLQAAPSRPAESGTPARRLRIVYTGTLWNLTSIAPLVSAMERLQRESPATTAAIEFVIVGRKTDGQQELVGRLASTGCTIRDEPYCDHARATEFMHSGDVLCLLLSDVPGADRVVPAKLFEYLATGKNVLAIVPKGETAGIVRKVFPDDHFIPPDVAGIAGWLRKSVDALRAAKATPAATPLRDDLASFSRRRLTGELAELFNRVVEENKAAFSKNIPQPLEMDKLP